MFSSRLHDLFPGVGPSALTPDPQTNQCRKPGAGWPDRPSESVRTDVRDAPNQHSSRHTGLPVERQETVEGAERAGATSARPGPRSCRRHECDQPWCGDWTGLCFEHAEQYLDLYADFCRGDYE